MDAALTLFEKLCIDGEDLINKFIEEEEQESLYLDFKRASTNSSPMEIDDRKSLGEALSGFANSEGGVLVWGVDARSGTGADEPDCAQKVLPIQKLDKWMSDLNSYISKVVQPVVPGAENFAIPMLGENNQGYAITYVPRSEGFPHMATARIKDQYSYYTRSGSSFVKMEAFMVADRFGRRAHPRLRLYARMEAVQESRSSGRDLRTYPITIGIKNDGLGLAIYPAIRIHPTPDLKLDVFGLNGNRQHNLYLQIKSYGSDDGSHYFMGGANDVVHPGTIREVTRLNYEHDLNKIITDDNVIIRYELFCDGFSASGTLKIPLAKVLARGVEFESDSA